MSTSTTSPALTRRIDFRSLLLPLTLGTTMIVTAGSLLGGIENEHFAQLNVALLAGSFVLYIMVCRMWFQLHSVREADLETRGYTTGIEHVLSGLILFGVSMVAALFIFACFLEGEAAAGRALFGWEFLVFSAGCAHLTASN